MTLIDFLDDTQPADRCTDEPINSDMMTISSTPSTATSTDSVTTANTNTPTSTPSINKLRTRSFSVV